MMTCSKIPRFVDQDRTLRIKIIDSCGMTCTFCHNEGTPVTVDNSHNQTGQWNGYGKSGRTSIYVKSNGVTFLPSLIMPDEKFKTALRKLQERFRFKEVHLTGGEPTLHPRLPELIKMIKSLGLSVGMTSNGENGVKVIPEAAKEGLHKINFSVFGTTSEELMLVQNKTCRTPKWGDEKIKALKKAMLCAIQHNVKASVNIVILDPSHISRVQNLLSDFPPQISIRIMRSLEIRDEATDALRRLFHQLGASLVSHRITAGVSDERYEYELSNRRRVWYKKLRNVRLPETCMTCVFNNDTDCHEGFYGIRLYKDHRGDFQVGVCIQRMDLCQRLDQFLESSVAEEIQIFQKNEYERLKNLYKRSKLQCPLNLKQK
ncbi:radical SAM protein [Shimazuella alba]|uniref:Radical SAM protein n=1 Tax=Shimazuella alba TaxID=2690964 RepID=A0A6I4W294_9BACL|nr:radical SAM protein [Shimazuella alba]MXQ54422.1 radical SAM protein [Shimazuella alba]